MDTTQCVTAQCVDNIVHPAHVAQTVHPVHPVIIDLTGDTGDYTGDTGVQPMDLTRDGVDGDVANVDASIIVVDDEPEIVLDDPEIVEILRLYKYYPLLQVSEIPVITLPPPPGPTGVYSGPNPFASLSNDPLTKILSFLSFCTFLRMRLVCKRFNIASQRTTSQWRGFLIEKGPRQITEDSVHVDRIAHPFFIQGNMCRLGKNGKCNMAFHYVHSQLSPVFKEDDYFAAYKTAIDFASRKKVESLKRRQKTLAKSQEQNSGRKKFFEGEVKFYESAKPDGRVPDIRLYKAKKEIDEEHQKYKRLLKKLEKNIAQTTYQIIECDKKLAEVSARRQSFREAQGLIKHKKKSTGAEELSKSRKRVDRNDGDGDGEKKGEKAKKPRKPRKARKPEAVVVADVDQ